MDAIDIRREARETMSSAAERAGALRSEKDDDLGTSNVSSSKGHLSAMSASASADQVGNLSTDVDGECSALLAWVQAVDRTSTTSQDAPTFSRVISEVDDLCDGTLFFELLASIDKDYFRNPHSTTATDTKDNWVLKIGTLKRLYKLIIQYYSEVLRQSPQALTVPDLDVLSRDASHAELARLGRFVLGIAIRSEKAEQHIAAIQTLDLSVQQQLMHTIEQVMAALVSLDEQGESQQGDHGLKKTGSQEMLEANTGMLAAERAKFEQSYAELMDKHRALQATLDDTINERDESQRELQRLREDDSQSHRERSTSGERQEIERLKDELRKSEDNLAEAERTCQSLTTSVNDLTRRASESERIADENAKLKDQLEELKHAADKLQRTENVMEKYKKKLEEGGEIRRQLKTLEEQNAELIERNASLEEDFRRVSHFKPLMDSYKTQISELETKVSDLQRDLNSARYENEQTSVKMRATEEARAKEKEELDLYQERVQELELGGAVSSHTKSGMNGTEDSAEAIDSDEDGTAETLQDAMSGTTMTGLKIQLRKLKRELAVANSNKADAGKLLVTENLLQDANNMKARYERDYLREYQSALKLRKQLEEIRSGKSDAGEGTQASIALRMRLNETVAELDEARKRVASLEAEHEQIANDLTIAKSDLHLVGKDKLEMIAEVRASIEVEKADIERNIKQLRESLREKEEESRLQLSQINALLLDKVDLQNDSIAQRDSALQRELERDTMSLLSKPPAVSADAQRQLDTQAGEIKALKDKLAKARQFVRQQDRLIKEGGNLSSAASSSVATEDESAAHVRDTSLERENKLLRQEQRLMMAKWHDLNMQYLRTVGGNALSKGAAAAAFAASGTAASGRAHTRANIELNGNKPKSWLLQQRSQLAPGISLSRR